MDLLFDSGSGLAEYQCLQLIGNCYCRLDAELAAPIGLDAVNQVDHLIKIADDMAASGKMDGCFQWIADRWMV